MLLFVVVVFYSNRRGYSANEARHCQRILDPLATHISRFFYHETRGANCEAGGGARFRGRRVNRRLRCFRCHPSAVRRVHLPSRLPPQGNNQPCSHLCTEGREKGLFTPAPATAVSPHHSHGSFSRLLWTKTCDRHRTSPVPCNLQNTHATQLGRIKPASGGNSTMRRSGREKTNGLRTSQRTSRVETTKRRVCRVDCRAGEAQSLVSGTI